MTVGGDASLLLLGSYQVRCECVAVAYFVAAHTVITFQCLDENFRGSADWREGGRDLKGVYK